MSVSQARTAKVSDLAHKPALIGFLNESTLQSPLLARACYIPAFYPLFDINVITEIEAKTMRKQQAIADLWLQKLEYDHMSGLMESRNAMS